MQPFERFALVLRQTLQLVWFGFNFETEIAGVSVVEPIFKRSLIGSVALLDHGSLASTDKAFLIDTEVNRQFSVHVCIIVADKRIFPFKRYL